MSKVIGIDLGTTNSCVAVMEGGEPVVIANAEGSARRPPSSPSRRTAPVSSGRWQSVRQSPTPTGRSISIKREMGSDYKVKIDDKAYSPQEISAMILSKLKADAEAYLGTKVTDAVITCPAYFNRLPASGDQGRG